MRKEYTVELLSTTEEEMAEAFEWYEEQQAGLSIKLFEEINYYLGLIAANHFTFLNVLITTTLLSSRNFLI